MAINVVPERLINFRVYASGNALLGNADIELPSLEAMSDTVSGAGIAGEVESPTLGHFGAMGVTMTWRTITPEAMILARHKVHHLEARGSQQVYDAGDCEYKSQPVRIVMKVVPKNISLGSFEVSSTTDTENEFECLYLKVYLNNIEVAEIDKYNFKVNIAGVDPLESVRKDLGMEAGGNAFANALDKVNSMVQFMS